MFHPSASKVAERAVATLELARRCRLSVVLLRLERAAAVAGLGSH
jgi:hypothetical protein